MALSRDKQILIAVVVLGGLGAAVYVQQKKDAKVGVESIFAAVQTGRHCISGG